MNLNQKVYITTPYDVVMVDDNEDELYIASMCYKRSSLTNPWRTFDSGKKFIAFLELVKTGTHPMPALVLLDINMPEMNGFEVLNNVRTDPCFTALPVCMMFTNSGNPRDVQLSQQGGANGFKTKPESLTEYVALFNSLLPPTD